MESRDSFLNCIFEQRPHIQHRPSLPLKRRPFFDPVGCDGAQQPFASLDKAQGASGSQSSCRSGEGADGEVAGGEGQQNDAGSRPSSFKLKYRTKDGQLMDIDGQNREEDGIALASPIRNDGKRRFFFEEIEWNEHQK